MAKKKTSREKEICTLRWSGEKLELIDQTLLPEKLTYISCGTARAVYEAITRMKVRGAPAIGIAGAYGVYLALRKSRAKTYTVFSSEVDNAIAYMASSRPTASNLFWALGRIKVVVENNKLAPVEEIKELILEQAHTIALQDRKESEAIGEYGKMLVKEWSSVLTHCNAGGLATGGLGTALSVIFAARANIRNVYVDETRPVLQGSRLTMWELMRKSIPATLICDNMAASLMAKKEIDAVIVGADRIVSNGDVANKIGTYNLAVLANFHRVPFYVAAPMSTFDLSLTSGRYIPIEQRPADEVKRVNGKYITPAKAEAINPAFDVTPARLITAIITEKGVIKRPDRKKIERLINSV